MFKDCSLIQALWSSTAPNKQQLFQKFHHNSRCKIFLFCTSERTVGMSESTALSLNVSVQYTAQHEQGPQPCEPSSGLCQQNTNFQFFSQTAQQRKITADWPLLEFAGTDFDPKEQTFVSQRLGSIRHHWSQMDWILLLPNPFSLAWKSMSFGIPFECEGTKEQHIWKWARQAMQCNSKVNKRVPSNWQKSKPAWICRDDTWATASPSAQTILCTGLQIGRSWDYFLSRWVLPCQLFRPVLWKSKERHKCQHGRSSASRPLAILHYKKRLIGR